MKQKTERDKADLVVRKIIKGMETTMEDQQVFINNAEYIEKQLQKNLELLVRYSPKTKGRL